jgi:hypothetical protein
MQDVKNQLGRCCLDFVDKAATRVGLNNPCRSDFYTMDIQLLERRPYVRDHMADAEWSCLGAICNHGQRV